MGSTAQEVNHAEAAKSPEEAGALAPRPKSIAETGLNISLLCELVEKHLYSAGTLTLPAMSRRTALAGGILGEVLAFLRREGRIEVRGPTPEEASLRYALTDRAA